MLRAILSSIILSGMIATAYAQASARQVYAPPTGFWLAPSNHSRTLYGASAYTANWGISQWNIPKDLPPFYNKGAQNEFASVNLEVSGHYSLNQVTAALPCQKQYPSGQQLVDEFDLLVQPNNRNTPGYPRADQNTSSTLDTVQQIRHEITVAPTLVRIFDGNCPTTQGAVLTAVVLTNTATQQTFFYQIRLAMFRVIRGSVSWQLPAPGWFFTGNNIQSGQAREYGYGDNITSYGFQPAQTGKASAYSLDLAPRLRTLIADGARYGMDQDLSHWTLSGTYHGQNAFGHVQFGTRWNGFQLSAGSGTQR